MSSRPKQREHGGDGWGRARRHALALLLGSVGVVPAWAALSDTFHPFVAVEYAYDDNLLRVSDNQLGGPASDHTRAAIAGLTFERPVGLQTFSGSVKATKVSFDRFSELDYTGKNAALDWHWRVGNRVDGFVGATYDETLNSFADFHSAERNLRTQRGQYAEARWSFYPSWRVRARASHNEYDYALQSQRALNHTENLKEAGLDYLASSGSTIGLQLRELTGTYPDALNSGSSLLDQGYTQREAKLKVLWYLNAVTQLQFLGGYAKREHDRYSQRDASGTNGRGIFVWNPTGAVRLTATAWREFAPFEGSFALYSLNKGASLDAIWAVTSKIQATATFKRQKRAFEGRLTPAIPFSSEDATNTANLGVSYAPASFVTLSASVYRENRSPAQFITNGYHAKGGSVSANFQF